jgi:hypothetical protein
MEVPVHRSQVAYRERSHEHIGEASELGWKPGEWPEFVVFRWGSALEDNDRHVTLKRGPTVGEVGFEGYRYLSSNGVVRLVVLND